MNKILMTAVVAAMSVSSAMAQQIPPVDKVAQEKLIELSNKDIAHPKRSLKAWTWQDRGKIMYDACNDPLKGIYDDQTKKEVEEKYGKGTDKGTADIGSHKGLKAVEYTDFIVYYKDDYVICWQQKTFVKGASLEEAVKAYLKAAEIDDSKAMQEDAKKALGTDIYNLYLKQATNYQDYDDNVKAADMCLAAYQVSALPVVNNPQVKYLYYAGYLYAQSNEFEKGAKYLKEAADLGETMNGDTYYYISYCYNMLKQQDKARVALEEGVEKFPENQKLIELLAGIYANTDENGEHLAFIEKAAGMFNKGDLWISAGRAYEKAGDVDKAVSAFNKALSINPDDDVANFNVGLMYARQAAAQTKILNEKDYDSQIEYDNEYNKVLDQYVVALPYLEKAVECNPTQLSYVEFLRDVLANLRERNDDYKAKYNKYVDMAKQLSGN